MKILKKSFDQRYAELKLQVTCTCGAVLEVDGPEIKYWKKGNKNAYTTIGVGFFCPCCNGFVRVKNDLERVDKDLVDYIYKEKEEFTSEG